MHVCRTRTRVAAAADTEALRATDSILQPCCWPCLAFGARQGMRCRQCVTESWRESVKRKNGAGTAGQGVDSGASWWLRDTFEWLDLLKLPLRSGVLMP